MRTARRTAAHAYGYADMPGEGMTPQDLIAAHIPTARRVAWHIHGKAPGTIEPEELVQMAMVALIEAANRHQGDPATFGGYAVMRIRGALLDEMRRRATMTRGALRRRRELINVRDGLASELGRNPTDEEVAGRMDLDIGEYATLCDEVMGIQYQSIDEVYSDHSMLFADDETSAFDRAAKDEIRQRLATEIGALPAREALVLQLYFVEELNLAEIAATLDVTAARVCQIKADAFKKLRTRLTDLND
jgi:RNA polymerase sigma factor for flagellar operon FliA|tara:strand:+ start:26812 stop:27552 length:741 start_codon:yes stop_codon:yes gene_type:complete